MNPKSKIRNSSHPSPLPSKVEDGGLALRGAGWWLVGALALHFVLGTAYVFRFPLWKAPDETSHFGYVEFLVRKGQLPRFEGAEKGNYEAHQPPLYYLMSTPFVWLLQEDRNAAGYALRWFSVFLGAGTVLAVHALSRYLTGFSPSVPILATMFAATLPMHLFVCSSISNDALVGLLCSVGLLLLNMVVQLEGRVSLRQAAVIGILMGAALLSKSSSLFLLIIGLPLIAVQGLRPGDVRMALSNLLRVCSLMGGFFLVSGWWLWRNVRLYGDPLAYRQFLEGFAQRPHPQDIIDAFDLTLTEYLTRWVGLTTFETLFGLFGEVNTAFKRTNDLIAGQEPTAGLFLICALFGGSIVVAIGVGVVQAWRIMTSRSSTPSHRASSKEQRVRNGYQPLTINHSHNYQPSAIGYWQSVIGYRQSAAILLSAALLVLLSFIQFNFHFFQAQSRYLYPAYPAWCIFFALGLSRLVPTRWHRHAFATVTAGMVLLNVAVLTKWMWVMPGV